MNYKKIFRTQKIRFIVLHLLSWIPDSLMLRIQYRIKMGRKLHLKHPKRFTEWLQWYKINYRNPLMQQCVDKFEVRKYIESKGCADYLVKLYGIYDNVNEIDFDRLPDRFVLKTTDGGGGFNVILCRDKNSVDVSKIINDFRKWNHQRNSTPVGREWAYSGIKKSRIIAEQLLEDEKNEGKLVDDYKFFCFNGKCEFLVVDVDRYCEHKRNFYSCKWDLLDVSSDCPNTKREIQKPVNLDKMIQVAEILSSKFPFVRVDLYNVNGAIYFGELTFYPWSSYVQFQPDDFDTQIGSLMSFMNDRAN